MSHSIKIGFPVPLTSVYGVEAHDQARSAQIAVDEFNESGGLDGQMAELLIRDTQHNPELTRKYTIELLDQERVHCIVGALSATDMVMIGDLCSQRSIVYNGISIGDGIVSKETRTRYTFHEGPTAFGTAETVGRYVFSHFGFRVATLQVNHPFGLDSLRGLTNVGNAIGVEFLANEVHALGEKSFNDQLKRISEARPDVLVTTNFGSDQKNMLTAIKEMGLDRQMRVVCTNLSSPQRELGGAELYEGVVGGTGYYWKIEDVYESSRRFNRRYREKHGTPPAAHGSYAYGGVKSVLAAIRSTKSTKSDDIIEGMLALRFDFCRGPQFYRRLDHQSVQPVIMLESKLASEMENATDIFHVLDIVKFAGPRAFHISYDKT